MKFVQLTRRRSLRQLSLGDGFFKIGITNPRKFFTSIFLTLGGILVVSYFSGFFPFKNAFGEKSNEPTPILVSLVPLDQITRKPAESITPTRPDKYYDNSLEICRDSKNKTVQVPSGWNSYKNTFYDYSLFYPSDWILRENTSSEKNPQVIFTKKNSKKAKFSNRLLPEIYITIDSPYSTSGSLCANQYCNENSYQLEVSVHNKLCTIDVVEGSVDQNGIKQFDFYAMDVPLPEKLLTHEGYSGKIQLYATASFATKEEGEEIARILSTLKY